MVEELLLPENTEEKLPEELPQELPQEPEELPQEQEPVSKQAKAKPKAKPKANPEPVEIPPEEPVQMKKPRGRPPGAKNKKPVAESAPAASNPEPTKIEDMEVDAIQGLLSQFQARRNARYAEKQAFYQNFLPL